MSELFEQFKKAFNKLLEDENACAMLYIQCRNECPEEVSEWQATVPTTYQELTRLQEIGESNDLPDLPDLLESMTGDQIIATVLTLVKQGRMTENEADLILGQNQNES